VHQHPRILQNLQKILSDQAQSLKIPLPSQDSYSNRALLAGFLMLWLKRWVVLKLSHEVTVADVIYPAVLLAFGQNITLLLAIVGCIQSWLQALTKTFCKVEALIDDEGNVLIDQNGDPEVKVHNPRVKLPYTYLVAWYVMHCPS